MKIFETQDESSEQKRNLKKIHGLKQSWGNNENEKKTDAQNNTWETKKDSKGV